MKREMRLLDNVSRKPCYPRGSYRANVLYTKFQYKEFSALYNLNTKHFQICDGLAERSCSSGALSREQKERYEQELLQFLKQISKYDDAPVEQIYGEICKIRKKVLGVPLLEFDRKMRMAQPFAEKARLIDQSRKKEELLKKSRAIFFVLSQPEYFSQAEQDLKTVREYGHSAFFLVSETEGNELPTRKFLEEQLEDAERIGYLTAGGEIPQADLSQTFQLSFAKDSREECFAEQKELLQQSVEEGKTALLFYGEDGFLQCRSLQMDSVVIGEPTGYYTRAVTDQLSKSSSNVVYIPKHWDITETVSLSKKTELSFLQLYHLWNAYGDEVYECSLLELYRKYPQNFLNIYENGPACPETEADYPLRFSELSNLDSIGSYYAEREKLLLNYFEKQEQCQYFSAYFDEQFHQQEIPWGCQEAQSGILVQAVKVKKARGSRVLTCPEGSNLHQLVGGQAQKEKHWPLQLYSNFLFFMTPKLEALYNELRSDRPHEQHLFQGEHLDFMICQQEGERKETFPLYHKSCIAMKKNGEFLFFRYRLGGGKLRLGNDLFCWTQKEVDLPEQDPRTEQEELLIYTPYFSGTEEAEKIEHYRKLVGKNRLNVVIIQEKVVCVRSGEVVLPSTGVVVSLEAGRGETFVKENGFSLLEDGYYDCRNLTMSLRLEPPEQVDANDWAEIEWAYGGGLSLILNHQDLYEEGDPNAWIREEGWMTPLSRQTQESEVHKLEKHPRTAIGLTIQGELVILVFSGRLWISSGADYFEMCKITKKLFPEICCLMNADGGGSALLGMSLGNSFMELSYPAPSLDSCPGMARPIHTVLCLPQQDEREERKTDVYRK